ncbi:MAG: hypothetical protein COC06_10445 [Bacteroidales bacterium]|nr:MAG: hypothetical protein COC06_10445 [Bacteroidales bacterium]
MFDYIFYRLYSFYDKKEKGVTPISTAAMYLSFLQILIVFFFYMVVNISLNARIALKELPVNNTYLKIGIVVFALLLDVFNYVIYKRKHKALIGKFRNHPLNKKFKVWMLYIIGAGLFLLPFLYREVLKML